MDMQAQFEPNAGINRSEEAIREVSEHLSKDIFTRALASANGDKFEVKESAVVGRVHGSALDEKYVGQADIEVSSHDFPAPIVVGQGGVTITPEMGQEAFAELVVRPLMGQALAGETAKTQELEIKLALDDGKELTGKMSLSFDHLYSN